MRPGKVSALTATVVVASLLMAMPVVAQPAEEFPGPDAEAPLSGYTRSDGTVVLEDESFCRFLLGSVWSDQRLTYAGLIDKTKKQRKARRAAFEPASDEATVTRCVEAITAYRTGADPAEASVDVSTLMAWARRVPVVPAALAGLLPEDFMANPLADPGQIGDAARTRGFGSEVTSPFAVTPGTWLAEVDAVACDSWAGTLRNARDAEQGIDLVDNREYLYDIDAGHYFWDVTASDCDWSVDLVPVVLGPEPTPTPAPRAIVPALFGSKWNRNLNAENPDYLTASLAREAVLAAGLVTGECFTDDAGSRRRDRVWQQDPLAGVLAEFGSAVDIWIAQDCDVYAGERVVEEDE